MSAPIDEASSDHRLADWFSRWRTPLRSFVRGQRALAPVDVDDITQEAFLQLMRYDLSDQIEHPQAYLYKMVSNMAAQWATRARHARPHDSRWLRDLVDANEPAKRFVREAADREVRRAIETLEPRQRNILSLRFVEDLTHAEIAERLGTTQRTVKRALIKSYGRLRDQLDPELLALIAEARA